MISTVNGIADKLHFYFDDNHLYAGPYIIVDGKEVYSDPPKFYIGKQAPWGELPYNELSEGWDTKLREAGISEALIDRIRKQYECQHCICECGFQGELYTWGPVEHESRYLLG